MHQLQQTQGPSGEQLSARFAALQHWLSAPVHTMIGYAQVLAEACPDDPETRATLQAAGGAAHHLLKLIEDVLSDHTRTITLNQAATGLLSGREKRLLTEGAETVQGFVEPLLGGPATRRPAGFQADVARLLVAVQELVEAIQGGSAQIDARVTPETGETPVELVEQAIETLRHGAHAGPDAAAGSGTLLVVDDEPGTRELLTRYLRRRGYRVVTAANGQDALKALRTLAFDLVVLDIIMPVMNGLETLRALKFDSALREVPVVILSAFRETEAIAYCIELGADDYLVKPFNGPLLAARIASSLDRKRLRDKERAYVQQIKREQERSRQLFLNILPLSVIKRLDYGQKMIADHFEDVTVVFCDLVDFTRYASARPAREIVIDLNRVFRGFDSLVGRHGVEKIKTVGDAYLAVAGLPEPCADHARRAAELGLDMLAVIREVNERFDQDWKVRIGIHSGPVTAGVIGRLKFAYDIWGDTVNVASRMESTAEPDRIQVSDPTYQRLRDAYLFEERPPQAVKGKGTMQTWHLMGRRA